MMYSIQTARQYALETAIRRAKNMARGGINRDFDIKHPNEVREFATKKTHMELEKRIEQQFAKHWKDYDMRTDKIGNRV